MAARGRGLFSLYIYIENFKNLLVRIHWTVFNIILQKCSFGDLQPGEKDGEAEGVSAMPLGHVSGRLVVFVVVSMGYQEEGMLAASFSVGWTVPLQGEVLSVSDYSPAAVSFAAIAAIVAVAWLLSLPLT